MTVPYSRILRIGFELISHGYLKIVQNNQASKHFFPPKLRDLRNRMLRNGVWVDSALVGCIVTAAIYWSTNRVSNWFGGYSLYGLVLIWYCRSGIPVSSLVCLLVLVLAYWSMVGDTIFDNVVLVALRSFVVYEGFLFRLGSGWFRCMAGRGCLIYLSLEDTPPMRYPYVYKVLSVSLSLALCWYSSDLKISPAYFLSQKTTFSYLTPNYHPTKCPINTPPSNSTPNTSPALADAQS